MNDIETIHELTSMAECLLSRRKDIQPFRIPERYRNKKGSALFQTVGQLIYKGKEIVVSGNRLEVDYQYSLMKSECFPKDISYQFSFLKDEDLFMVFPNSKDSYILTYNFDNELYTLYKTSKSYSDKTKLFELKVYSNVTIDMISSMFSKLLFVY